MNDRILAVPFGYTCQFMYRGLQISYTTQEPKEVVVFPSEESSEQLFVSSTVEKALEWVNENYCRIDF